MESGRRGYGLHLGGLFGIICYEDLRNAEACLRGSDSLSRTQDFEQHRRFRADEAKSPSRTELNDRAKKRFHKCFDELYELRQKCAAAQGSCFDGGCASAT
ncbi:hypothetical protein TNCV_4132281 [Trichonephila clavipes]|nr:hypothetical protein TNCV_4132281 [Trichonephila clavipes]